MASGPVPERAKRQGLTAGYLEDQMYKTGGTPYLCVENKAKADPGLFVPAASINQLRRKLIAQLSEERAIPPERDVGYMPKPPADRKPIADPKIIFQLRSQDQLQPELAELKPDYLYLPAQLMEEHFDRVLPFINGGTTPVAVLPRVIFDGQTAEICALLERLFDRGVREVLLGNLGHVVIAKRTGMRMRGDFGLNSFNSQSLEVLRLAGFQSATASFELRMAQIRDLRKPLDLEMIIYGRLPLMVSEQNLLRSPSGRIYQDQTQLADRMGSVFPVVQEYGQRSVIYNAHKLYMADRKDDLYSAGLWGLRLLFSNESGRECVEVAKGHLGQSDYRPNVLTRGVYYRGVD